MDTETKKFTEADMFSVAFAGFGVGAAVAGLLGLLMLL